VKAAREIGVLLFRSVLSALGNWGEIEATFVPGGGGPILELARPDGGGDLGVVQEPLPLGRFQTPKDIGEMAAFLASDRAVNITGAAFNVDGGWEMH
jgi:NAD(P)-dependent dehydrogenase (short-subunit alcohol dehydrogenase family)